MSAGRCVAVSATRDRHLATCRRWARIVTFAHSDTIGVNQLLVVAVMPANRLASGSYRLLALLPDTNGHTHSFLTPFRIR